MGQDQQAARDANRTDGSSGDRALFHEQKRAEAMGQLEAGDTRTVTVEADLTEYGHRDDALELGTISIQDAGALAYFLEYHRDYDHTRAATVRVEGFGPLSFAEMNMNNLYPAPHDGLGAAHKIVHDLLVQLDSYGESEECFVRFRIH